MRPNASTFHHSNATIQLHVLLAGSYPRFCSAPLRGSLPPSVSPDASLAPSPEWLGVGLFRVAAPGLAGVTRLHRRRCDETKRLDAARGLRPLRRATPSPLTLLPAARSPSRPHCCRPLVGSYPTVSALVPSLCSGQALRKLGTGILSVAVVVVRHALRPIGRPHLRFREAAFLACARWESGSSSLHANHLQGDGSPANTSILA